MDRITLELYDPCVFQVLPGLTRAAPISSLNRTRQGTPTPFIALARTFDQRGCDEGLCSISPAGARELGRRPGSRGSVGPGRVALPAPPARCHARSATRRESPGA